MCAQALSAPFVQHRQSGQSGRGPATPMDPKCGRQRQSGQSGRGPATPPGPPPCLQHDTAGDGSDGNEFLAHGPSPGSERCQERLDEPRRIEMPLSSWPSADHEVIPKTPMIAGEPARVPLNALKSSLRRQRKTQDAAHRHQLQTLEERLTEDARRILCKLAGGLANARGTAGSSWEAPASEVTDEQCGALTEGQRNGGTEERCGVEAAELMEEHRIEIAKLSRALSVLPQQAAYTLVRLEVMQSHGNGPRRALGEAVRMIQNVLVLACSREVALVDLRERGIPVALKARLAQVCREAMGGGHLRCRRPGGPH